MLSNPSPPHGKKLALRLINQRMHMTSSIIDYYKKIEHISEQMLHAAQNSAWDNLFSHEKNCKILISELREHAKDTELSNIQRKEKLKIMQNILRNDAKIRVLLEPWIDKVNFSSSHYKQSAYLH